MSISDRDWPRLIFLGAGLSLVGIILWGIIGLFIPAVESEQTLVWKTATRICAVDEITIGIIAIYSCI